MIKYFDNLAAKIAFKIAETLVKAKIKPMSVTVFRFIIAAPVSWYFFSRGQYLYNVVGLFLYMAFAILDWVDGDMAQLYKLPKKTAPFGRLIDHTSDRILMLIVLGSFFYAGMNGTYQDVWIVLTVLYYSIFFFLSVSLYEFDKRFNLDFESYPEIDRKMHYINPSPGLIDKILFNILYVHNNSITRICFTHNYVLIAGILTNQLLPVFIFITFMHTLRSAGIFSIMYRTLKVEKTDSALISVLREYQSQ